MFAADGQLQQLKPVHGSYAPWQSLCVFTVNFKMDFRLVYCFVGKGNNYSMLCVCLQQTVNSSSSDLYIVQTPQATQPDVAGNNASSSVGGVMQCAVASKLPDSYLSVAFLIAGIVTSRFGG
jgi:hypothetical protein